MRSDARFMFSGMNRACGVAIMWCAGAAGLIGAPGCEWLPFKGEREAEVAAGAEARWPFWPVAVRVHPFTSLSYDEQAEAAVLEAWIELIDPAGDVTKGIGQFRLELYMIGSRASREGQAHRLHLWDVAVETVQDSARHFDSLTRTHQFRLRLEEMPETGGKLELRVQFTDARGERITTTAPITRTPRKSEGVGSPDEPRP